MTQRELSIRMTGCYRCSTCGIVRSYDVWQDAPSVETGGKPYYWHEVEKAKHEVIWTPPWEACPEACPEPECSERQPGKG